VIVRVMGEGQYRLDDELLARLNTIDNRAAEALEREDEEEFRHELEELARTIRERGQRLDDSELVPSDLMMPPTDLSLEEARELFSGEGLIPDLPGLDEGVEGRSSQA
jgi:hypothetical protein